MQTQTLHTLSETCGALARQSLPRWQELPDLDLYMDQVLSLVGRYLGAYPGFDGKGLTASMVNNYVKMGVMPPPVRKKYTRTHLACLLIICILKTVLPIAAIQQLLAAEQSARSEESFYDGFCTLFAESGQAVAESYASASGEDAVTGALCRAALRAQAEQTLALRLASGLGDK